MLRRVILSFLVVPLLLAGTAAGQGDSKGKLNRGKSFTIWGKVSEDGRNVIEKNGKPWLVTNPAALAGHENQQVKVKCQIPSGSHDIQLLSVKLAATQTKYAVNLGDSAFRR